MKKFLLKRYIRYTETFEIEAESLDDAKKAFEDGIEFDRLHDDTVIDESIECLSNIENA